MQYNPGTYKVNLSISPLSLDAFFVDNIKQYPASRLLSIRMKSGSSLSCCSLRVLENALLNFVLIIKS